MSGNTLPHRQEKQKRRKKCKRPEFSTVNMDIASDDVDNHGHLILKRKADGLEELEGPDEKGLSRKERKRLRRLAKEKEKETGSAETRLGVDSRKKKHEPKEHTVLEIAFRGESTRSYQQNQLNGQKEEEPTSTKDKKRKIEYQESSIVTPTPSTSLNSTAETTPAPPSEACPDVTTYLSMNRISIHTPPNEDPTTPILTFGQLDIPSNLLNTLLSQGFEKPTPIQACAWPALIKGKDVVGVAETGSGKTLAFGMPAFVRLLHAGSQVTKKKIPAVVSVLVIAPTRELAIQTYETLDDLGRPWGVGSVCVYGGVDKDSQRRKLQGIGNDTGEPRIVVGTPGRLLDFVQEGCLDLSRVTYLVLDEADRMLDRGFENDIRHIIEQTADTSKRQTVMFSATWPESVRRLASTFQKDPIRITVGSEDLTANCRIEQVVEVLDDSRSKDSRLLNDLRTLLPKSKKSSNTRVLVFALYKAEASRLTQTLERNGYTVSSLHGSLSQPQRIAALHEFKTGNTRLMVATDVAARGLDIPEVEVVINYTFPLTIEDYVHRIGRTGRAGRSGRSITYFTGEKHEYNLAGQLAKVLHESGFECEGLKKFPMTIKKKVHGAYGAFFKETSGAPVAKKIRF